MADTSQYPFMTISVFRRNTYKSELFVIPNVGRRYDANHTLVVTNPLESNDDIHSQLSDFQFERLHETIMKMQDVDITYSVTDRTTGKTTRYHITR